MNEPMKKKRSNKRNQHVHTKQTLSTRRWSRLMLSSLSSVCLPNYFSFTFIYTFVFFSFLVLCLLLCRFFPNRRLRFPHTKAKKKTKGFAPHLTTGHSWISIHCLFLSLSTFNRLFHLILHFLSPALFVWVFILDPRLESKCFVYFFIFILGSRGAPPRAVDGGGTF